jgi:hypothetical protein
VKQVRLLPVVVMAASALLVLKTFGIVSGQGYILGGVGIAQEVEHTAPVPEDQSELSPSEAAARALFDTVPSSVSGEGEVNVLAAGPGGVAVPVDFTEGTSEAAILQRLAERRAELEAFAGELEARLAVVEAAEIRIEERMAELNAMETSINALVDAQENAEGHDLQRSGPRRAGARGQGDEPAQAGADHGRDEHGPSAGVDRAADADRANRSGGDRGVRLCQSAADRRAISKGILSATP